MAGESSSKSAKKPLYIARTLGDVAAFFGVQPQTVKEWRKDKADPMPGEAGKWPLDEIAQWKIRRVISHSPAAEKEDARAEEMAEIKLNQLRLEYARQTGNIVDCDSVERVIQRAISYHNSMADEFGDRVFDALPKSINADQRKRISKEIERGIDELKKSMADMAETWAEEVEDDGSSDE